MGKYNCSDVDCGRVLDPTKVSLSAMEDWVYDPRSSLTWCPDHIPRLYYAKHNSAESWKAAGFRVTHVIVDEVSDIWEDEWTTES